MKSWQNSAPSNIALIKYMGKDNTKGNVPSNSSLSYSLGHLRSYVRLSLIDNGDSDHWEPLSEEGMQAPNLSAQGKARFLDHLRRMKEKMGGENFHFLVQSANDFPSDCGLASSASSFAALTMTAAKALSELTGRPEPDLSTLAGYSREASGSSCRSFFETWAVWEGKEVCEIQTAYPKLGHLAVVVESSKKLVSSSEAHRRVLSSLQFQGRPQRADARKAELTKALADEKWQAAFELSWAEFWDMHALFESSRPAFSYLTPDSLKVLRYCQNLWASVGDAPLVTMDAGANVHLLFRLDQRELQDKLQRHFSKKYTVIASRNLR